jgi:hypothetical protein
LPWLRSRASEVKETRAPGGNQLDLTDRRERRHRIYRLRPISIADSGGACRNRAWRRWGDAVARAGERKRMRCARGCGRSVWPKPPGRVRPGRSAPTGGPGLAVE